MSLEAERGEIAPAHGRVGKPQAAPTLRRLAALNPKTIALMHGPAFTGDGGAALTALADYYASKRD